MRFNCPYCGERGVAEFLYQGDATVRRPRDGGAVATQAWTNYVYFRDNPYGVHEELWYHSAGCHAWLVVTRDLRDHAVLGVRAAKDVARERRG
jgi:sarcosine oxidase subunit delta